jgi:hypothetical protein
MFVEDCKEIVQYANKELDVKLDVDTSNEYFALAVIDDNNTLDNFYFFRESRKSEPNEYGLYLDLVQPCTKEFDSVTIACLICAKYHFGNEIYISTDGQPDVWVNGMILASVILGANLDNIADHIFDKPTEEMKAAYKAKKEEEYKKSREGKPARHSIDTKDVAKLVRKDLKQNFPGQKFQVTIDRYSGGSSIDVRWINGPTREKVESLVGHYCSGHFDGMNDIFEYNDSPYCNNYIFCQRELDHDLYVNEVRRIAKDWGVDLPSDLKYNNVYETLWQAGQKIGSDLQHFVCEEIAAKDY